MQLREETHRQILDNLTDGVYIVDTQGKIVFWNHAAEKITGFSADEVLGSSCSDNLLCHVDGVGSHLCHSSCPLSQDTTDSISYRKNIYVHHRKGHRIPISSCVIPLTNNDNTRTGKVEIFSDVSAQLASEYKIKELEQLAMLDSLTQLANRHYLDRELQSCLEEKRRYGYSFGLLFMDVDNFKAVNDRLGHDVGDRVLQFVAGTMTANSRPYDLFARWGGEEFVGIIKNITGKELKDLGERLRHLIAESFLFLGNERLQVTVSVGATLATDRDSIDSLLQRSDRLMYRSKTTGKNKVTFG